jgi:hypothetical protein
MSGTSVLQYVKDICRQLDEGRALITVRRAAVGLLVPAALLPACPVYAEPAYGMPMEEYDCTDGMDDDGDGLIDCYDDDCPPSELCLGCDDGIDNDGDGAADCDDDDCDPECT